VSEYPGESTTMRQYVEGQREMLLQRLHKDLKRLEAHKIADLLRVPVKDPNYTGQVDFDGNPIKMFELVKLLQDRSYSRVGLTQITDDIKVSTVWLGMDFNFGTAPPIYYETMVIGGKGNERVDRYTTLNAAQEGHTRIVEWVKAIEGLGD